jgi:CubicO group peptidase (beta-lactamase class C family)
MAMVTLAQSSPSLSRRSLLAGLAAMPLLGAGPPDSFAARLAQTQAGAQWPGVVAARFNATDVVETVALGVRRADRPGLVQAGDMFHIASNTKALTAMMLARLVQTGQLNWSTTVADIWPEWAGQMTPLARAISLDQLLRHAAALPAWTDFGAIPDLGKGTETAQRAQAVRVALTQPLAQAPGGYLYSNLGYAVAAHMAETVTGEEWRTLLTRLVLEPLEVEARFDWPPAVGAPWGHVPIAAGVLPADPRLMRFPAALSPAGHLSLAMPDFVRALQPFLGGRPGFLSADTLGQLRGPNAQYALGWGVVREGVEGLLTHEGTVGSFYSAAILAPDRKQGVALCANLGGEASKAAGQALVLDEIRRARVGW